MKHLIWKKTLPIKTGIVRIQVPKDSTFLSLQVQDGFPTVWFRFPADNAHGETDDFPLLAVMTGHPFDLGSLEFGSRRTAETFLGTVQVGDLEAPLDGPFVLHYFEVSK